MSEFVHKRVLCGVAGILLCAATAAPAQVALGHCSADSPAQDACAPTAKACGQRTCGGPLPLVAPNGQVRQAANGMRIYIDPQTGALLPQAAAGAGQRRAAPAPATDTSPKGLVIVDGPTPAHGQMLDLQGRFQNEMRVHMDASGTVKGDCAQSPAADE